MQFSPCYYNISRIQSESLIGASGEIENNTRCQSQQPTNHPGTKTPTKKGVTKLVGTRHKVMAPRKYQAVRHVEQGQGAMQLYRETRTNQTVVERPFTPNEHGIIIRSKRHIMGR
jgi:hypothetical protein